MEVTLLHLFWIDGGDKFWFGSSEIQVYQQFLQGPSQRKTPPRFQTEPAGSSAFKAPAYDLHAVSGFGRQPGDRMND